MGGGAASSTRSSRAESGWRRGLRGAACARPGPERLSLLLASPPPPRAFCILATCAPGEVHHPPWGQASLSAFLFQSKESHGHSAAITSDLCRPKRVALGPPKEVTVRVQIFPGVLALSDHLLGSKQVQKVHSDQYSSVCGGYKTTGRKQRWVLCWKERQRNVLFLVRLL